MGVGKGGALCVVTAVLLAGCLRGGSDGGDAPQAMAAAGPPGPLELQGCREQIGVFPVRHADAASSMPPGFSPMPPVPPSLYPGADPSGQAATLLFVAFLCEGQRGQGSGSFLIPWYPAVPPAGLAQAGVTYHAVAPILLVSGDRLAAWFASAGLDATRVDLSQADLAPETAAGIASEVRADGEAIGLALTGASPKGEAATPAEWLRLFAVDRAMVTGVLDLRIGEHLHWQFGASRVSGYGFPFAIPDHPGLATHSAPGFSMSLTSQRVPG